MTLAAIAPDSVFSIAAAEGALAQLTAAYAELLLRDELRPKGVGVVLQARQLCMSLRSARASGSLTITFAPQGLLRDEAPFRAETFAFAGVHR